MQEWIVFFIPKCSVHWMWQVAHFDEMFFSIAWATYFGTIISGDLSLNACIFGKQVNVMKEKHGHTYLSDFSTLCGYELVDR